MPITSPATPCIGVCSTIYGDEICRGCKRHFRDIIDWNHFSDPHKQQILSQLEQLTLTVMRPLCAKLHRDRLEAALKQHRIRYRPDHDSHCWAYQLLRALAGTHASLTDCGITLKPPYQTQSIAALYTEVDTQLQALATQNFQRQSSHS